MKVSPVALAVALLPAAIHQACAQDRPDLLLDDVVITANRSAQPRSESSAAVTVFTREDIERLRPGSVTELLERVPGVQVVHNGGRGSNVTLLIRGTSNDQTLLLIDGQRSGPISAGGGSLQYLSVEQIERVEVLRGSRSALYGADAIGGVVQIFTRRGGQGLEPRLRIAGGSQGTWERSLGLSGGGPRTRFSLNASLEETQGIDHTGPSYQTDADHDAYRNQSLAFSLVHRFNDALEGGLNLLDQRGKSEYDNPYGREDAFWNTFAQDPYNRFAVSNASVYLDGEINRTWSSRVELGHSEDKLDSRDKLFPQSDRFNSYRDSVTWLNTLRLGERHSLLLGADYLNDKLRSNTAYDEQSRWNQAGFVQHSYRGQGFSTELGLRHDKNQQYGSENTWNAALTLPVDEANTLVLSYAEGFRAPTFNQLYYPASPVFGRSSNPDLSPETSKSYELQWRSQLAERTRLEASVYRTDIRDLIAYDTTSSNNQNVATARINGFEAALAHELLGWQANLAIGVIDPRNRDSGKTLARRAKRTLSLDLDRRFGSVGVGASWLAVSRSYDDAANTRELAGYGVLDLRGSWQASSELSWDLKLSNLLDKQYSRALYSSTANGYSYYGYESIPRSLMVGFTWTPSL